MSADGEHASAITFSSGEKHTPFFNECLGQGIYYTLLSSSDQTERRREWSDVVRIWREEGAHLAEARPDMPWSIFDYQAGS